MEDATPPTERTAPPQEGVTREEDTTATGADPSAAGTAEALYDELPEEQRKSLDEAAASHLDDIDKGLVAEHYEVKARLDRGTSDNVERDQSRLAEIDEILASRRGG